MISTNNIAKRSIFIILNAKEYLNMFVIFTTFCIQGTDIKLGFVKFSELFLLIYFFCMVTTLSKSSNLLFYVFCMFLITSLIVSALTIFYPPSEATGGLKQPFLISISRFLELLSCLGFVEYIQRGVYSLINKGYSIKKIFDYIVLANCLLGVLYICELLAILLKFQSIDSSLFYYDNLRLKGTFAEGGPNGLCLAFLACTCLPYCSKTIRKIGVICFVILIILSQSKAALMMMLCYIGVYIYKQLKLNILLSIPFFLLGLILLYYVSTIVLDTYINGLVDFDRLLVYKSEDPNFVMGRIAGVFIVPKIIFNNFWFGAGLGNYALIRNNPLYSGVIPDVSLWDAPGLGGLVDLFIETGFLGFSSFVGTLAYIYVTYLKPSKHNFHFLICFIMPYLFGVQLYFQYPWFALGAILAFTKTDVLEMVQ